jgi:hypothetical protein
VCWPFGVPVGVCINFSIDDQIHVMHDIFYLSYLGENSLCVNYG